MRSLTVLMLFLCVAQSSFSQQETPSPCDALIESGLDSLTGVYSTGSKEDIIVSKDGKDVLSFVFLAMDKSIILFISALGGVYCIDETNKVNITFRDGSTLEMPNNGKFNCDGGFSLFFFGAFGNKKEYGQFMTKEIEKVRVGLRKSVVEKNRDNFIEVVIPPEKSKLVMQIANCLVE